MKRKIFTLLFLFLLFVAPVLGQIAVNSFRLLENDLTAMTNGTQEIDQNGEVAALIKVVTSQKDFTFDNGMIGITKVVPHPGEYWVYVPKKTQKINIYHENLGVLRDYYFPTSIESGRTYEMVLTTGEVITTVKKTRTTQYLLIHVNPPEAVLFVDDELQPKTDKTFFKLVSVGRHTYRVQAAGYKATSGVIEVIPAERAEISVELQSLKSTLNIVCEDEKAEIVVNEDVKGNGRWTGEFFSGMYIVEARREGHRSITEEVTLGEMEKRDIVLSAPIPIFGTLRVESDPIGAGVFIDGKRYGSTPCILEESDSLLIGGHVVNISLEGYADTTMIISIEDNEEFVLSDISLKKRKNFSFLFKEDIIEFSTKEDIIEFLNEKDNIDYLVDNVELLEDFFKYIDNEEEFSFVEKEEIYELLEKEGVKKEGERIVIQVVESMPEFPGGTQALLQYLRKNVKYPESMVELGIQGRVVVQFVVDKDGSIVDSEVINHIHPDLDLEALRVVRSMPRWKPGEQRGKPVRVKFTLPIPFKLYN